MFGVLVIWCCLFVVIALAFCGVVFRVVVVLYLCVIVLFDFLNFCWRYIVVV